MNTSFLVFVKSKWIWILEKNTRIYGMFMRIAQQNEGEPFIVVGYIKMFSIYKMFHIIFINI